jgi:hypothetical protein|tara:strand:- start:3074 stop:3295 length:222 start_codon:yes stop_codon:yes gene_type:complete
MAGRHKLHDGTGVVASSDTGDFLIVAGTTVPTDGASGYATGCLFLKTDGGAGTALYCNEGTNSSANFDAVTVA